jgi:S1-C subfamily serine protease
MSTLKSGISKALAVALVCIVNSSARAAEPVEKMQAAPPAGELRRKLEAAQNRLDSAAREIADLSMTISEEDGGPATVARVGPRAVLGVNIGGGGVEERTDGVEIISVSPGGAAAEAGIRAGDVLTEVEGKALKNDDAGTPRNKLLAAMRRVQPEEKVVVKYLRDGKTATATLTPRRVENRLFTVMPGMPFPGGRTAMGEGPHMGAFRVFGTMGGFGNAELVSLTPKLGQYFGADKGLLVVRAPNDSRFKLEEGDVILDIDGRVPSSPSHAMRILSSYQTGEKLKLNVLRMKKRTAIDVTVPEERDVLMPAERGAIMIQRAPEAMMAPMPAQPFELPVPAPD